MAPLPPVPAEIKLGFDTRTITLTLAQIKPSRVITDALKDHAKYKQILTSIREVGVIEPPVVAPDKHQVNSYSNSQY